MTTLLNKESKKASKPVKVTTEQVEKKAKELTAEQRVNAITAFVSSKGGVMLNTNYGAYIDPTTGYLVKVSDPELGLYITDKGNTVVSTTAGGKVMNGITIIATEYIKG